MSKCNFQPTIKRCLNCYDLPWCDSAAEDLPNVDWEKERKEYCKRKNISLPMGECVKEFIERVEAFCEDASTHNIHIENYNNDIGLPVLIKVAYHLLQECGAEYGLDQNEYYCLCDYYETELED